MASLFTRIFKGAASTAVVAASDAAGASPAAQIVEGASKIIGMFKLSDTQKAEMEQQLTMANLDMEKTALAGQVAELEGQIQTNASEAESKSIFVSGWRPAVGWVCAMAFGWAFVIQPFAAFVCALRHYTIALPTLDLSTMMPVLLGMLGLGTLRSYEKVQGVPDTDKKD